MTGLFHFSQDAASNDVAAPPILWTEGMPANAVNNSARELMAALANWHADVSGGLVGTGTAGGTISLSTNQGLNLSKPFEVAFQVDATNTGPLKLSVDGSVSRDLTRASGRGFGPGDLAPGIVYRSRWVPALNRHVVVSPAIAEPGIIIPFAGPTPPAGYLLCYGQEVSRTAYAGLFLVLGTRWGAGDGSTTFRLPDLRGRALFGVDNMGGTPANRLTGTGGLDGGLGDVGGNQAHTLTTAQMPSHSHTGEAAAGGASAGGSTGVGGAHNHGGATEDGGSHTHTGSTNSTGGHIHTGSVSAGGDHSHTVKYSLLPNFVVSNSSGSVAAVVSIGVGDTIGAVDLGGNHAHPLTIDAVGDHNHTLTINTAPVHAHAIPDQAGHTHTIPAAADHTHDLEIDPAGGGAAHPNVPPGAVVLFAIKA